MGATAQELVARLRRDPNDADAFASLRAHYGRIGDYASLANLLEGWANRAADPAAGAQALWEAGELVLGALSDRERAIRLYERALSTDPHHADAFLRLRGLFEEAGETRRLIELIERHAGELEQAGGDRSAIALLHHQLGELWEQRFTRVDKAVQHFLRAFELDASFVPAIYAAREIYRQAGNTTAALSLLEKEARAETDEARRLALWRELAHARVEEQGDHEGAAIALKRALADAPGDLEVMNELAGVYLARAERVNDELIAASDRLRAAELFHQLAQKVAPEHALGYLESALDARPEHDGALALYETLTAELGEEARLPGRWVAYLAEAPDGPEAAHRRLRLADAYLEAGQVEYAITCLEWLLDAGDPHAAARLVDLYRSEGRDDDALRALGVAAHGAPPGERIAQGRELMSMLRDRGDLDGAARWAQELLAADPSDPEALTALEDVCRQSGEYAPLRDALLSASRVTSLSIEGRKERLKDVASLSELRLGDLDGAIAAWRAIAALDPADREPRGPLKRLLSARERWDELADVLEREAHALTEPEAKAEAYRQLAALHRDQRDDLDSAILTLRQLLRLRPEDREARDALCDLLLEVDEALEAVPLLRQRIDESEGEARVELLRKLASLLEQQLEDFEGAFAVWARLLDERPSDLDALSHMEAIDLAAERHERLLSTLSYRLEVVEPAEQPLVLARMARIAESSLGDVDRASELYERALELAPDDTSLLDSLMALYERAERYRDLVVLLRELAHRETDVARRAELYRRIARTLAERVGSEEGAAEAWREVLAVGEDEEALRFLRRHATRQDDPVALDDALRRLGEMLGPTREARDLALERAEVLAERLDRIDDAIAILRGVIERSPDHVVALARLAALCERKGDLVALADALWRQLELHEEVELRLPIARRLSDLHESEAPDPEQAVRALFEWVSADREAVEPLERLTPLLERAGRFDELTRVLDARASLSDDREGAAALWRQSAQLAHQKLGDVEGAWRRLEPLVRGGDAAAEEALRELAKSSGSARRLAELYVAMADGPEPRRRWLDAARVYEDEVGDAARALEAVLRALALDMSDLAILEGADRLAERAGAWARLGQVYDALIRHSERPEDKVALLLRHAALLDERAGDVSTALDQTLRACALAPNDDASLAHAEDRATRAGRADELLVTYDKRKQRAQDDAGRVEALMRSVRLCESVLRDRERATIHLAQAVALTVRSPELEEVVTSGAQAIDAEPDAMGGLRRVIADLLVQLAGEMDDDPIGGARLLSSAARLLSNELGADEDALALFQQATRFAPSEGPHLDELERFGRQLGRLPDISRHLAELIDEALDNKTAADLLRRHAVLLEELGRFDEAAEAWTRLTAVASNDADARARLREALRRAGKHQDLLISLQRDLRRADAADRLELLREVARLWENELGNRFEAIDAWKKVEAAAPEDRDARDALARLAQSGRREPLSESLEVLDDPDALLEDYGDLTDPADEHSSPAEDSSETMLSSSLYAELAAELEEAAQSPPEDLPPLREEPTRQLDPGSSRSLDAETRPLRPPPPAHDDELDDEVSLVDAPALQLSRAPDEPPSPALPPPAPDDFDDEYTAVGDTEDVFHALRGTIDSSAAEADDESTGEIELLDAEELGAELAESDVQPLDELEEIEEIDSIEELDSIEEIQDLDELEEIAPPFGSVPPPPRRG